jgi:3'(2'),5'-bisphosphate nucleotidase
MLEEELEIASELAKTAGRRVLELWREGLTVERKAFDEPVTRADREASSLLVDGLRRHFPADAILSEEAPDDTARLTQKRVWMIDPIDGTNDFIRGYDGWSIMVGLVDESHRPVLGVVHNPPSGALYRAARGQGAYVVRDQSTRLKVSTVTELDQIRLVASKTHRDESIDRVKRVLGVKDEQNVGSVGLKLGLIAEGLRDLYVNTSGHSSLWDACAPEAILVESGGLLTTLHGQLIDYRSRTLRNGDGLVASNGVIHQAVVSQLQQLFPTPPA